MSGKITWVKSMRTQGRWDGKLGEVTLFIVTPWEKDAREGVELKVLLPGHNGEVLWPKPSLEAAQEWSEEILKDFLKAAGLQVKPAPKPRKAKTS